MDTLNITFKTLNVQVTTKHTALRALAYGYYPLGLLVPFLSPTKVFTKNLWTKPKKQGWGDPLDRQEEDQWKQLCENIRYQLPSNPDCILPNSTSASQTLELCVFEDASKRLLRLSHLPH